MQGIVPAGRQAELALLNELIEPMGTKSGRDFDEANCREICFLLSFLLQESVPNPAGFRRTRQMARATLRGVGRKIKG